MVLEMKEFLTHASGPLIVFRTRLVLKICSVAHVSLVPHANHRSAPPPIPCMDPGGFHFPQVEPQIFSSGKKNSIT